MSSLSVSASAPRSRHALTARSRQAVAAASLTGLVAGSAVVVLIAAERPSLLTPTSRPGFFPQWMAGPLHALLPGLTTSSHTLAALSSALIGGMYLLYVAACATAPRLNPPWTIAALVAIHVVFFLAPPLSYTDVFNYFNYGRMGVLHHLNPYTVVPALGPHGDPAFALSNWHNLLSPYGPLFTLLTYALVPLGVAASFWTLKVLIGAASLATLALVWKCAERLRRNPTAAVAFVGLNPIVLIWGLGADHNDALMMLFVALAIYGVLRHKETHSGAALVAATFIKASAAVLLPILLAATRRSTRRRFLAGAAVAAGLLALASLVAFGPHLPDLATQSRLVTAIGIPNLVGLALGLGGETTTLHTLFTLVDLGALSACALWTWRRPANWLAAAAVALLVVVVSLSWAAPWYILWVLPFAALAGARRVRAITLVLGAYFVLAFMPAAAMLADDIHLNPPGTPLGLRHTREIMAVFGS